MSQGSTRIARRHLIGGVALAAGALALAGKAQAENQPHMQPALQSLRNARSQLQNATADKGGHRNQPIALVNQAIDEVQRGIAFDNRR